MTTISATPPPHTTPQATTEAKMKATAKARREADTQLHARKVGRQEGRVPPIFDEPHKALLKCLRRLNKSLARKVKGSATWHKVMRKLARLHDRMVCIRHDALQKLTHRLATQYRTIGIETLNVQGICLESTALHFDRGIESISG